MKSTTVLSRLEISSTNNDHVFLPTPSTLQFVKEIKTLNKPRLASRAD